MITATVLTALVRGAIGGGLAGNWMRAWRGTRPGTASFVPPPPQYVADCMGALERFLHKEGDGLPVVVRAALAHVPFETIHPFLDGNGRVGRLLITFLLCHRGVLREPLLYLSLYFKQQREEYYGLLDRVRTTGGWEAWLSFFLDGVRETADGADPFRSESRQAPALRSSSASSAALQVRSQRHCAVVLLIACGEDEGHRAAPQVLLDPADRLRVGIQLRPITPHELLPARAVVAEPLAQFGAGRHVLEPEICGRFLLAQPPGPQALHQDAQAVFAGRRFIDAFQADAAPAHGVVERNAGRRRAASSGAR